MLVYRIETEGGTGAYFLQDENGAYRLNRTIDPDKHPVPWDDPDLDSFYMMDSQWDCRKCSIVFGFASLEQYNEWFTDEMREIVRPFTKLSVYDAADVLLGEKQLVFNLETAQLMERREI